MRFPKVPQQIDLSASDPEHHQKYAHQQPGDPVGNLGANDFYFFQNGAQTL
jgi:hypothetical protein